jgi:RHS repeat-associated protein
LFIRPQQTFTNFAWDGNVPLHEWKTFTSKDALSDNIITWVFEEDSFSPIAKIKNDKQYSIINDHLGTPIEAYADDGKLIWERSLNSNGKVLKETGFENFCQFLYQGQSYDSEIDLAYNRFRYYDPEEGRYISQDPIGLLSGEFGFYNYVEDPNGWIDVLGLKTYRKKNGQFGKKPGRKSKKKKKGQANQELLDSASRGRQAHRNYKNALPSNYDFEVTLENGSRVDAIDWNTNTVRELKPDTKSGISKGVKQLDGYVKQLESQTGEKWTGILDTYSP